MESNKEIEFIKQCRLCNLPDLDQILEWGDIALANAYVKEEDLNKPEDKYPLTILKCNECGHIQLRETINSRILFSNYLYASSTSGSLAKYFEIQYVPDVIKFLELKENDFVIDLGGNDGVTLKFFKEKNFRVLNIEPAKNLAKISQDQGIDTINDFFSAELSNTIKRLYGYPNLIICNNAYMHLDDHQNFTMGVANLMNENTKFVFENAYFLRTLQQNLFDQYYHDHRSFLTVKSLNRYLNRFDLELYYLKETPIQCGSLRCYVKNKKEDNINELVNKYIKEEEDFGLYSNRTYYNFRDKVEEIRQNFVLQIINYRNKGKTISCYACPAKFALFSKIFGLNNSFIKYVVDDSVFKQGLYSPESKIKIVSQQYFKDNPTDVCIISASNFADLIKEKNQWYKGIFINPFENLLGKLY